MNSQLPVTTPPPTTDLPVRLSLPGSLRHLRLARLAVACLAGEFGYSMQAIEDLRVNDGSFTFRLVKSNEIRLG